MRRALMAVIAGVALLAGTEPDRRRRRVRYPAIVPGFQVCFRRSSARRRRPRPPEPGTEEGLPADAPHVPLRTGGRA